jgi:hypothetical protein
VLYKTLFNLVHCSYEKQQNINYKQRGREAFFQGLHQSTVELGLIFQLPQEDLIIAPKI